MQSLFLRYAAAPGLVGLVVMAVTAGMLAAVGAFSRPPLPEGFASQRQLLGINLLLVLLPPYLITAWGLSVRRSARLLAQVDSLIEAPRFAAAVVTPGRILVVGAVCGFLYAVFFNIPISTVQELRQGGVFFVSLIGFMILVWVTVGVVLSSRLHVAGLFRQAGRVVPVDPYDLSSLEPFARSGMGDVALAIGALVLQTVQSIDATFRFQNYLYSTIVGVPAMLALLFLPMYPLHRRLRSLKLRDQAMLEELIRTVPREVNVTALSRLETLLQHRDRIQGRATWPLNVAMIYRLLIYGVIPPIAWVSAALVERFVEKVLGG